MTRSMPVLNSSTTEATRADSTRTGGAADTTTSTADGANAETTTPTTNVTDTTASTATNTAVNTLRDAIEPAEDVATTT